MKLVSHERHRKNARDDWETPKEVYRALDRVFDFQVDVAADYDNTLCRNYIDVETDALDEHIKWSDRDKYSEKPFFHKIPGRTNTAFCNPPFKHWASFAAKAVEQMQYGVTTVLLVPPRLGTIAWHTYTHFASEIIIPKGRLQFTLDGLRPTYTDKTTGEEKLSSNGADTVFLVFRPRLKFAEYGTPKIVYWNYKRAVETHTKAVEEKKGKNDLS